MKTAFGYRALLGATVPLIAGLALAGCNNFLDKAAAPKGTLNEQTLSNANGVEGSLIATYRDLDWNDGVGGAWGYAASNWVWGSAESDDAYKGSEASDQPPVDDIEFYQWSTANSESYLNDMWRGSYEGVVRSNATIRLLDEVQKAAPGTFSTAEANGIRGEAMLLRAHYHFNAWRMWGNIPYFRETDTDVRKANETSAEVIADVIKDIDSASVLLTDYKTPRKGQKGRVTYWTARAYLGRAYAYKGDWANALTVLRDVKANGPYALETSYDKVWTGFTDEANGPETILAYQASANDGQPNGDNANYGERLNFPHSGSPFGCCGFHQPSQNLANFFKVDGTTGLPDLQNANPYATATPVTTKTAPGAATPSAWNANEATLTAGVTARGGSIYLDPRIDWTIGRDSVPYKDWGLHLAAWIRAPGYGGRYSPKKNAHEQASGAASNVGWTPTQLNSVNIHIFRYADALLMLAEAEVEAGSLANAQAIVNQVRARAAQKAQGPGTSRADIAVAIDDPRITWANYKVSQYPGSWSDKNFARTAVRNERRLELAMEGQRFFDLKRWGATEAEKTLNSYLSVEQNRRTQLQNAQNFDDKHMLFPIPQTQVDLSKVGSAPTLTQNPGW